MTKRSVPGQVLTDLPCLLFAPLRCWEPGLGLRRRRAAVLFARGEDSPRDAGGLGGLGDDGHFDGSAGKNALEPGRGLVGPDPGVMHAGAGAEHEESAQAAVTGLADVSESDALGAGV